jgi:hypothetical protein
MFLSIIYDLCTLDKNHGVVSVIRGTEKAAFVIETLGTKTTEENVDGVGLRQLSQEYRCIQLYVFAPKDYSPDARYLSHGFRVLATHSQCGTLIALKLDDVEERYKKDDLFALLNVGMGESESHKISAEAIQTLITALENFGNEPITAESWVRSKMSAIGVRIAPPIIEGGVGRWLDFFGRGGSLGEKLDDDLLEATGKGDLERSISLLNRGANIEVRLSGGWLSFFSKNTGNTPLMNAVLSGNLKLVAALLGRGANLGAVNRANQTALLLAEASKRQDIIGCLMGEKSRDNEFIHAKT